MENQTQAQNLKPIFLILGLLLVLGGGGFAIWMVMKKEDQPQERIAANTEEQALVSGRQDVTNLYTEEQLSHTGLVNHQGPDRTPEYTATLVDSNEGKRLIEARMEKIQLHLNDADFIRAKHQIGKGLVDATAFSHKALDNIGKMFALIPGVTQGNHLTYPVYGKFETKGEMLRGDLEEFLGRSWNGYNLTEHRHSGSSWWLDSVGLNLMYGNQNAYVHTADQIWWYKADRNGLDFYKVLNGHDVGDHRLLDKKYGKGVFNAGGAYKLAEIWLREMDKFDKVTRQEAITALEKEGLIRRI